MKQMSFADAEYAGKRKQTRQGVSHYTDKAPSGA
jgi:hypothetical protein